MIWGEHEPPCIEVHKLDGMNGTEFQLLPILQ